MRRRDSPIIDCNCRCSRKLNLDRRTSLTNTCCAGAREARTAVSVPASRTSPTSRPARFDLMFDLVVQIQLEYAKMIGLV